MPDNLRHVPAEWLHEHLHDSNVRVIDATVFLPSEANGWRMESGRAAYEQAHVPSAVFADLISDLSDSAGEAPFAAAPSEQFATVMGTLGVSNESTVVAYDQANGIWATRMWWQLALEGFDNAVILDGGLQAWQRAGFDTATGVESYPPASFVAHRRPEMLRSTADVEAAITDPDVLLVNALDAETYAKGHIPGSVNVPFGDLVDAHGELKSRQELRELFAAAGALDPDKQPVTYCGGGIAATAAALALAEAGRDDVAVYDGSMNAWTADPQRPLQQG
ncbi:sulfurtransferase [Rhodococcus sp. X156]|uniref:sulfurtransferase n=1 Tax=Rhodococcus sp. X156 TaxID=2499145 RepID=UPI000FDA347E|nr:sulfurtransferase [Rhodococcus sp. X156]